MGKILNIFFKKMFIYSVTSICFLLPPMLFPLYLCASSNSTDYKFNELIEFIEVTRKYDQLAANKYLDPTSGLLIRYKTSFENTKKLSEEYIIFLEYRQKDSSEWTPIFIDEYSTRKIVFNFDEIRKLDNLQEEEFKKGRDKIYEQGIIYLADTAISRAISKKTERVLFFSTEEAIIRKDYNIILSIENFSIKKNNDNENNAKVIDIHAQDGDHIKIKIYKMVRSGLKRYNGYLLTPKEISYTIRSFGLKPDFSGLTTFKARLSKKTKFMPLTIPPLEGLCINIYGDYRRSPNEKLLKCLFGHISEYIGVHLGFIEIGYGIKHFGSLGVAISYPCLRKYFSVVIGYGDKEKFTAGIAMNPEFITGYLNSRLKR